MRMQSAACRWDIENKVRIAGRARERAAAATDFIYSTEREGIEANKAQDDGIEQSCQQL